MLKNPGSRYLFGRNFAAAKHCFEIYGLSTILKKGCTVVVTRQGSRHIVKLGTMSVRWVTAGMVRDNALLLIDVERARILNFC